MRCAMRGAELTDTRGAEGSRGAVCAGPPTAKSPPRLSPWRALIVTLVAGAPSRRAAFRLFAARREGAGHKRSRRLREMQFAHRRSALQRGNGKHRRPAEARSKTHHFDAFKRLCGVCIAVTLRNRQPSRQTGYTLDLKVTLTAVKLQHRRKVKRMVQGVRA
jgi:hypothetical protein